MSRGLVLGLIVLAVLAASLWALMKGNGGSTLIRDIKKGAGVESIAPTTAPTSSAAAKNIPPEFQSGNSRFSQGSCTQNSGCKVGGCSGEVCSNSGDIVSTCEYSDSFPSEEKYSCSCLPTKVCGWQ